MTETLAKYEAKHDLITYRQATDVAGMCKEIVLQTAIEIQRRKYVRVEGWQAIAVAHGCVASARDVERIEGGVRAIGEVRRGSDGMVLATAEGFVGDDEDTWGKRAEYAKRAMAQTRAISRACRSAFAHVVVMMNAGLETTPAEEVPPEGFERAKNITPPKPAPQQQPAAPKPEPRPRAEPEMDNGGAITKEIVVGKVTVKEDTGANGKPYTKYSTKADDGEWYSTFDTEIGDKLQNLAGDNAIVTYELVKGKYRTITQIVPLADPARDEEAIGEDKQKEKKEDDNLPF